MKKWMKLPGLFALLSALACKSPTAKPDFLTANMDTTINPGDDFFMYANGGWIKNHAIPDEEAAWGIGNLVDEEILMRLKDINEKAKADLKTGNNISQKIGHFWASGLDSTSLNKNGISPLTPWFDTIKNISSANQLHQVLATMHEYGMAGMFNFYVAQDDKNSEEMACFAVQGGLGLPNRDFYFSTDQKSATVRQAYQQYLQQLCKKLWPDTTVAKTNAVQIFELEKKLAAASRKLVDLRDPYKNYNVKSLSQLQQLTPNFNWNTYLSNLGVTNINKVIVGQPEFFTELNNQLTKTPIETWKAYLQIAIVKSCAKYVDDETYTQYFTYAKTITGAAKPKPRWKRVLETEQDYLGEALGQLFVKEYFNDKAKKRYSDLVESIREAYKERIKQLKWMSDSTKAQAINKLEAMTKKVGYPDKWKDFSDMNITQASYVTNVLQAQKWWHQFEIKKLGKPVDRTLWDMSPQTYNAYYNPSNNEIVLPAGIFVVPGMKDEELDDAFVYGYAGASTIGHEITHGFDDQGRQYDAKGNLKGWWKPSDSIEFVKRTQNIIRQFNAFIPVDTLHVNGEATQGENIADLGGLLIAIDAFKKTDLFKQGNKIHGYTPMQRFFLGYAFGWMYQTRKENLASRLKTDVHAPAKERVNGPMANLIEFYKAFNVKQGNKLFTNDSLRVDIW